jgi:hypothetical protein
MALNIHPVLDTAQMSFTSAYPRLTRCYPTGLSFAGIQHCFQLCPRLAPPPNLARALNTPDVENDSAIRRFCFNDLIDEALVDVCRTGSLRVKPQNARGNVE